MESIVLAYKTDKTETHCAKKVELTDKFFFGVLEGFKKNTKFALKTVKISFWPWFRLHNFVTRIFE